MKYTIEEVITIAESLVGKSFGDYDVRNKYLESNSKGRAGHVMESGAYDYEINNKREPDFKDIGVELKTTGYKWVYKGTKVSAKERLVITMINYFEDINKEFIDSSVFEQIQKMLLILYEYEDGKNMSDMIITNYYLYNYKDIPEKDKLIIENDYKDIINKIKNGEAHELSEGNTMYLGAAPKGKNRHSVVDQPFSDKKAMRRAFSLKTKYMTSLFRKNIFNEVEDRESFIKDLEKLKKTSFDDVVNETFKQYSGMSLTEISKIIDFPIREKEVKHILQLVTSKMMNVSKKNLSNLEEFHNANIEIKTINVGANNNIKESMSFPAFNFEKVASETWEESKLNDFLYSTRFLFVVFKTLKNGEIIFLGNFFWNMQPSIIETEVKKVWEKTNHILNNDLKLKVKNNRVYNNFPKMSQNDVAHVRPHARDRTVTNKLPDSTNILILENDNSVNLEMYTDNNMFTKQCFWLNSSFILEQVRKSGLLKLLSSK